MADMYEVKTIIRPERVPAVVGALHEIEDLPGITISVVRGVGRQRPTAPGEPQFGETVMTKLEIVVPEPLLQPVLDAVRTAASTGRPGDGKVFVSRIDDVLNIRSGVRGSSAL